MTSPWIFLPFGVVFAIVGTAIAQNAEPTLLEFGGLVVVGLGWIQILFALIAGAVEYALRRVREDIEG